MRHLGPLAATLACLLAAALLLDQLAARSSAPGVAWVFTRGTAASAFDALLAAPDVRVLDAWAGGRVLQLQAEAIGGLPLPPGSHWLALRLPRASLAWPGCG